MRAATRFFDPAADAQSAREAAASVAALYEELDVPEPSAPYPIAPLGPLCDRLKMTRAELPGMNVAAVTDYLRKRRFLDGDLPFAADGDAALAGFLFFWGRDSACLLVNAADPVVRRRFSVAHELGHFTRHFRPLSRHLYEEALRGVSDGQEAARPRFDAFTLTDEDANALSRAAGNTEENADEQEERQEREADGFAAALLMPETLVRERHDGLRRDYCAEGVRDRLAMELLVSRQAMERRLRALQLWDGERTGRKSAR